MKRFAPVTHVVGASAHPADVLIERDKIGDRVQLAVLIAQRDGGTRRIGPFDSGVQFAYVGRHVVAALPDERKDTPHHHRRVVEVLGDDLAQLLAPVGAEALRREIEDVAQIRRPHKRQVDPRHEPLLVEPVVKIPVVRARNRMDGIGPHIAQKRQILVVIGGRESIGDACPIVIERHTVQTHRVAVDQQSVARRRNPPEAGAHGHLVGERIAHHARRDRIEIRRSGAPEPRSVDGEGNRHRFAGRTVVLVRLFDHHVTVGIADRKGDHPQIVLRSRDIDLSTPFDRIFGHRDLLDEEAVGSPDHRRHGHLVGQNQRYVAVDASVDILLGRGGQHVVLESIADHDQQVILRAEFHAAGDFEREGRESPAMLAHVVAVDEDVGDGLHAVETQKEPLRSPVGRNVEPPHVVARGTLVLRIAGQRIEVPRMGQGDMARVVGAVFAAEIESPVVVETIDLPRRGLRSEGRQRTNQKQVAFHNP